MATEPEAKHQHLDKSLKMKYKALKELENGTTHRDVASLFGAPKNTHPPQLEKTEEKIFQS